MTGSQNRLLALTKQLRVDWDNTRQYWNDAKSREFEKEYLEELLAAVNHAITNIDSLERLLAKIHADCD